MNTAESIAAVLGNAHAEGNDWRCDCPVCHQHNLTLSNGDKRLLVKCFNGCDGEDVLAELHRRNLYGIKKGNGHVQPEAPETRAEHEARATSAKVKRQARIDAALDIWRNSYPAADTNVATYLASRLLLDIPPALRFVPSLWHKQAAAKYPAMVGLVEHIDEGPVGIHCVFLNPLDASVRVTIEPRKWSLGPIKGGAVRLAPAGSVLAIAEGVEDALTFMQATRIPSWAAITASGIRNSFRRRSAPPRH